MTYQFVIFMVRFEIAACDSNCVSCNTNGPNKCDPGNCKAKYVYESTSMTCKGVYTQIQKFVHSVIIISCKGCSRTSEHREIRLNAVALSWNITGTVYQFTSLEYTTELSERTYLLASMWYQINCVLYHCFDVAQITSEALDVIHWNSVLYSCIELTLVKLLEVLSSWHTYTMMCVVWGSRRVKCSDTETLK